MKGLYKIACFLLIVFNSLCINANAQAYLEFVENKGQWKNDIKFKGQMANGAFALQPSGYKVLLNNMDDIKAMNSYFHPHDISGNASKKSPSEKDQFIVRSHAYAVKFLGANEQATIVPEKPLSTYNNYFIDNDPSKWASECKIYQAVTYQNIYPNVDVRYYTSNNHLKYDIIVRPGGDASKIAMYFDGVDGLKNKNGDLLIKTSVGDINELSPYSYQLTRTAKKDVPCSFEVRGNIVRFKTEGKIEDGATLVIDPTLIFCTFTGSTADNWGYTATYDAAGNLYAGGTVFSQGFPVSTGAYQTVYSGGQALGESLSYDIGIIKFNPTGTNRIYATYIGGSNGSEQPHSLVVDNAGNLIVAGRTSASNYPTAPAGNSTYGAGGGWDIIVSKLNATGTQLIGSRRIGGTGSDGVNMYTNYSSSGPKGTQSIRRNYGDDGRSEVIVDNAGNIYVASCTQSYNSFPTSAGAAQTSPIPTSNFYQDAVALKLSPDLTTVFFSTLIGGSSDDAAFVLSINPTTGNIYVAGATRSTDLPGNFSGSIFPSNQGGPSNATDGPIDGFIQVLNPTGTSFLQSTYIGTPGVDLIYGIQFDKFSYPYIMGTTTGSWPIVNAPFNQSNGKQFIAKLKQDLSGWEYSTVFGNNVAEPNLSPTAFLVDRCENVYVSGWGGKGNTMDQFQNAGTLGLTVTPDAYKPSTDGSDFYFFVMERNAASQLYGSFFGQNLGGYPDHVDGGTSRFDRNGIIYQAVCANCFGGAAFPTTPGVWAETNGTGSTGCNLAAIKMAFNLSGVGSGVQSSIRGTNGDTSGCVPLTVSFRDTLAEGTKYIWNFGDGSPQVTTTAPNASHLYTAIGTYRVMLVSIDSSKCNIADTSYLTMRVRNDDAPLAFDAYKLQPCTALAYNFVNNSIAPTNKPFKTNSFKWDFGDGTTQISGNQTVTHAYAAAGTYNVKLILIDTNYCNEPDTVIKQLRVSPVVKAQFETPTSGCAPYTALFNNTSLAGTDFIWDFGDGSPTSTAVNPTHLYSNIGTYTIKLIAIDTSTCNKIDSTSFTLVVSGKPTSAFVYTPNPPTPNTAIIFTNNSVGGSRYKWQFGDGDTLVTTNQNALVSHIYNVTQLYRPCLITFNIYGCTDTTCQDLQARVIPGIGVPNAFTPNQDGNNDIIYVNGYGIKNMTWRIYNRWGVLMFTSTNKNVGWDGRYNGVMQPQDVYMYSLQVDFTDGTSYSTKGDITLLR